MQHPEQRCRPPPSFLVCNRPLTNVNCVQQPRSGLGGLFIGDVIATLKTELLQKHCVTAVLSCMAEGMGKLANVRHHKKLPMKDTLEYPIGVHFSEATSWIDRMRKQGQNVLVHCHAGVSRSATVVVAYLMRYQGLRVGEAVRRLRAKRERVKPNAGFMKQLQTYEVELRRTVTEKENEKVIEHQALMRTPSSKANHHQREQSLSQGGPSSAFSQKQQLLQTPKPPSSYKPHQPRVFLSVSSKPRQPQPQQHLTNGCVSPSHVHLQKQRGEVKPLSQRYPDNFSTLRPRPQSPTPTSLIEPPNAYGHERASQGFPGRESANTTHRACYSVLIDPRMGPSSPVIRFETRDQGVNRPMPRMSQHVSPFEIQSGHSVI